MSDFSNEQSAVLALLEDSILLSYEQKLDLVDAFPALSEEQINAIGQFLATEEQIREEYGDDIKLGVEKVLKEIVSTDDEDRKQVYVGVGKPS
jgi:hypothetical protein